MRFENRAKVLGGALLAVAVALGLALGRLPYPFALSALAGGIGLTFAAGRSRRVRLLLAGLVLAAAGFLGVLFGVAGHARPE